MTLMVIEEHYVHTRWLQNAEEEELEALVTAEEREVGDT